MKINLSGNFSLGFGKSGLLQFFEASAGAGIEVKLNDFNCYWVFVDFGSNDFGLLAFQNKSWFDGWLKAQPRWRKIKIIQSQGIE